jgi:hypothetical protein
MTDGDDEQQADPEPTRDRRPSAMKTKRRPRASSAENGQRPPLDADGRERPRFLLEFPSDPELEMLIAAFEQGNYARVRRDAPALAARTEDAEVRRAALELRRRLDPDPLLKYLLGISVALLLFLTAYVYATHRH